MAFCCCLTFLLSLSRCHPCSGTMPEEKLPHPVKGGPLAGGRIKFANEINTFISHIISW